MSASVDLSWWQQWWEHGDPKDVEHVLSSSALPVKTRSWGGTMTLIDWDDTLFPTTALQRLGYSGSSDSLSPSAERKLAAVERAAVSLVRTAARSGPVAIVSAASRGWIVDALSLMPMLNRVVRRESVALLSARDDWESSSDDQSMWKYWAFRRTLDKHFPDEDDLGDVVVVGDGWPERQAASYIDNEYDAHVKTLRVDPYATPDQLACTLAFLAQAFSAIEHSYNGLSLQLSFD